MDQNANWFLLPQVVVEIYRFGGAGYVDGDAASFQGGDGLGRDFQAAQYPACQDDHLCPMLQQFFCISQLNAGRVVGAGLIPIPFARSARIQLGIFELPEAFNFKLTPGVTEYLWGNFFGFHTYIIVENPSTQLRYNWGHEKYRTGKYLHINC